MKAKIARYQEEAAVLQQEVGQVIVDAANRFLVDEQGRPTDGALYWYNRQAIVRLGARIEVIPIQTMDEKKIFANGDGDAQEVATP
jgi:hypothetical protein